MKITKFFLVSLTFFSSLSVSVASNQNDHTSPLDQDASFQKYLAEFPHDLYEVYDVPEVGSFYVDIGNTDGIKAHLRRGQVWEPYILEVLKKYVKPGTTTIDIGGHIGTIAIPLAKLVGDNGKVFTFECEKDFMRELIMNARLNHLDHIITPMNFWIGKENTVINTIPYFLGGASEFAKPSLVEMRTLDSFNFQNVSLMKIDVECTEDDVLDGAYQTIMNNRPVLVIELMGGYGEQAKTDKKIRKRIQHSISKLEAMNYKVSKIWIDDYLALPVEYQN